MTNLMAASLPPPGSCARHAACYGRRTDAGVNSALLCLVEAVRPPMHRARRRGDDPMRARHHGRRLAALTLAALLALGACSSSDDDDTAAADDPPATSDEAAELPAGYEGYVSETYADDANWLCKPGIADDVCSR